MTTKITEEVASVAHDGYIFKSRAVSSQRCMAAILYEGIQKIKNHICPP